MTQELSVYEKAKYALAEYKTVDEVKDLRDKAMALRVYAKQANDRTLEGDALEARLRAERRLGQMMEAGKDDRASVGNPVLKTVLKPTLKSQNIDENLAKSARTLARMTDEEFEARVEDSRRILRVAASRSPQVPAWKHLVTVAAVLRDVQKDVYKYKPEELRDLHAACVSLAAEIDKCVKEEKVKWLSTGRG